MFNRILQSKITAGICLVVPLVLTGYIWSITNRLSEQHIRDKFTWQSAGIREAVERRAINTELTARAIAGLMAGAQHTMTTEDWHAFVKNLDVRRTLPGVIGIGFARADGQAGRMPVVFQDVINGASREVSGLDLSADPGYRKAIERAMTDGQIVVSSPGSQQAGPLTGAIMLVMPVADPSAGANVRSGVAFVAFRIPELLNSSRDYVTNNMKVEIYDRFVEEGRTLLYQSDSDSSLQAIYGEKLKLDSIPDRIDPVPIGDKVWSLRVKALPGYRLSADNLQPTVIGIFGVAISVLLFITMLGIGGTARRAQVMADKMTQELREQAAEIQEKDDYLRALVREAPDAILVMNTEGVIEETNPEAQRLLGYTEDELRNMDADELVPQPFRASDTLSIKRYLMKGGSGVAGTGNDLVARKKDGSLIEMHLRVGVVKGKDAAFKFIGIAHDLTNRQGAAEVVAI